MSLSYYNIFNLDRNFNYNDLQNSYNNRVNSIIDNKNITDIDKKMLLDNTKVHFRKAYNDFLQRKYYSTEDLLYPSPSVSSFIRSALPSFNDTFSGFFTNESPLFSFRSYPTQQQEEESAQPQETIYSSSTSHREKLMPDGSRIVLKETSTNKNGDIKVKTSSYRKLSSGATEPIEYEEGLRQIENKVLV
jgi:hypothetical protein